MTDNKKQPARKVEDLTNMKCSLSTCGCKLWQKIKSIFCSLIKGGKAEVTKNTNSNKRIPPSTDIAEEKTKAPAKKPAAKKTTTKKPAAKNTTTKKASPKSTKTTTKKAATKKPAAKKTDSTK